MKSKLPLIVAIVDRLAENGVSISKQMTFVK